MPNFSYRALTADGQTVSGALIAGTRQEAAAEIKSRGLRPLGIEESLAVKAAAKAQAAGEVKKSRSRRIKNQDILVFTSQLAALLKAGIVMSQALSILEEQSENASLSQMLHEVREDIQGGASLSEALEKYPKHFTRLYC
ncbi:MAG: type II secretion system F family protein, partial [Candidatus Hinthialibacter sp.]